MNGLPRVWSYDALEDLAVSTNEAMFAQHLHAKSHVAHQLLVLQSVKLSPYSQTAFQPTLSLQSISTTDTTI